MYRYECNCGLTYYTAMEASACPFCGHQLQPLEDLIPEDEPENVISPRVDRWLNGLCFLIIIFGLLYFSWQILRV